MSVDAATGWFRGKLMPPPEENDALRDADVAVLRRWIIAGAAGVTIDAAAQGPTVTDQDRAFWAFRPPEAAPAPPVVQRDRVRSPIDAFLLARLKSKGLSFSVDVERRTWLRRT